jgi:hypothetical protein
MHPLTLLAATVATTLAYSAPTHADDSVQVASARAAVSDLLASRQQDFRNCFEASLKDGRLISDATFYFEIGANGRAEEVRMKTPGYVPKSLRRCLRSQLGKLRFPPAATALSVEHRLQVATTDPL